MTLRQEVLLCNRCLEWIRLLTQIVDRTNQAYLHKLDLSKKLLAAKDSALKLEEMRKNASFPRWFDIANELHDVSLIPVILEHLEQSCIHLRRSSVLSRDDKQKIKHFRALYRSEDIKNLRDVIEHLEEYIVGKGKEQTDLVKDPEKVTPGFGWNGVHGLSWIGVFGKTYNVVDIIKSTLVLKDVIEKHKKSLAKLTSV